MVDGVVKTTTPKGVNYVVHTLLYSRGHVWGVNDLFMRSGGGRR